MIIHIITVVNSETLKSPTVAFLNKNAARNHIQMLLQFEECISDEEEMKSFFNQFDNYKDDCDEEIYIAATFQSDIFYREAEVVDCQ